MAVEVSGMAGNAGATFTAVDRGVSVAVGAINAGTVDTGMASEAVVLMHGAHGVALMASDAEGGSGDG